MNRRTLGVVVSLLGGLAGCPAPVDSSPDAALPRDTSPAVDSPSDSPIPDAPREDAPRPDTGTPDAPLVTCPAEAARPTVTVSGELRANATWTCANNYLLSGGPVYVVSGVTLTIDPGVVVRGEVRDGSRACEAGPMMGTVCTGDSDCPMSRCGAPSELGTVLVVTRGAQLQARGTAAQPIVFTSERTGTASEPLPGNWGGIVMLGDAPTNNDPADGAVIEGLPPDARGTFGGANPTSSCGELSYARIEYAGFVFGRNNELNGLTMGGCGSGTVVHHVQVHRGLDDGIEIFGGTVNVHHAIVTGTGDDSLDFDLGWTGSVQFFIAQQRDEAGEERCIEGDGHPTVYSRTPLTRPSIYNFTCIGAGNAPGVSEARRATLTHDGVILRRGASAILRNSIFYGSPDNGIQLDDQEVDSPPVAPPDSDTVQLFTSGSTLIENNILFDIGDTGAEAIFRSDPLRVGGATTMEGSAVVALLMSRNRQVDPAFGGDPNDLLTPDFSPSVAAMGTLSDEPTDAFFVDVDYAGAVAPDDSSPWYLGWSRLTD